MRFMTGRVASAPVSATAGPVVVLAPSRGWGWTRTALCGQGSVTGSTGEVAVTIINHYGDEVIKVSRRQDRGEVA